MRRRGFTVILAVVVTLLGSGLAYSNPTHGSIRGTVYDRQTREPIPSANVLIVGSFLGAATDQNGRFTIPQVPIGSYQIQVSVLGYKPLVDSLRVVASNNGRSSDFFLVEENIQFAEVQVQSGNFTSTPDAPVSNRCFSRKEMQNSAGGLDDVMRAIRILPGVAQAKADRTDLIVRGGAPSENLSLVDNVEVPYISHFSTQGSAGGAVSIIDMDLLVSSSFSAGGFGVSYGDKLSSVLDVKLREGRTDRVHSKATVSPTQIGLNIEGPVADGGSFIFSVRESYLDYAFRLYDFGFTPRFTDLLGKATYSLGMEDKLTLMVVGAMDRIKFLNDTDDHRYENSRLLFSNQDHAVEALTWRHLFSNGYATLVVRHSHSQFEYLQFREDLAPAFQSSAIEGESSVRGDVVIQYTESTELAVGAEFKALDEQSSIDLASFELPSQSQSLDRTPGKASVYAQVSKIWGDLRVTVGVRGSYFDLITQNAAVAPRLSSVLALSPVMNLSVSIGRYYQSPSYVWLASNSFNRGLSRIGVNQVIVGIDRRVAEDLNVSLEGYVKQYFNYPVSLNHPWLVMANTGAGAGGMGERYASFGIDSLVNAGTGLAKGIELSVQKRISDLPCHGILSIAYSESRFVGLDGVSRPSDYDQRLILIVGGGYIFGEKWEVSGRFRLYAGRPYTPFGINGQQPVSEYNSARVPVNHQLDLRVARQWEIASAVLETYVDIQNVYDRKPVDAPMFSERRHRIEQVPALGIVPTIGLAVQF